MVKEKQLRGFKFCLHKAYFDKGIGLTNYVKYIIAFFGIATGNVKTVMWIAAAYAIFCYILGRLWYKFKLIEAEIEVGNRFNLFVKEIRKRKTI